MKSILIAVALVFLCVGAELRAEDWSGRYQVKVTWYERSDTTEDKAVPGFAYGPSKSSVSKGQKSLEEMMKEKGAKQVLEVVLPLCKDRSVNVDARLPYPFEGAMKGRPGEGWDGTVSWMKNTADRVTLKISFSVSKLYGDPVHPSIAHPTIEVTPTLDLDTPLMVFPQEFGMIVELQKADPRPEFGWDLYEVPISKDRPKVGSIGPLTGKDSLISQMKLDNVEKLGSLRIPLVKGAKVTVTGLPGEDGKPMDNIPSGAVKWIPLPTSKIYRLEMEVWLQKHIAGDEVSRRSIDKTTIELQEGYGMAMGGLITKDTEGIFIVGVTPAHP